jgi:hypothetical protein
LRGHAAPEDRQALYLRGQQAEYLDAGSHELIDERCVARLPASLEQTMRFLHGRAMTSIVLGLHVFE